MTKAEIFSGYILPVLMTAITALAGFLGTQVKRLCQRWVDDRTKQEVVRTCVKAAEQLYHHLGGPEKLQKAQEGIRQMLEEKGIPITELEMNILIESVVSEFNYGFGVTREGAAETVSGATAPYAEEEGASL